MKSSKLLIPDDCVLVSKLTPHIPRVWLPFDTNGLRRPASTEFVVIEPLVPSTLPFLYALVSSPEFIQRIQGMVTGTKGSHQRVPPNAMLAMSFALPPVSLVEVFSNIMRPMHQKVDLNRAQSTILAKLRDALLPRLLSGELRVSPDVAPVDAAVTLAADTDRLVQSTF